MNWPHKPLYLWFKFACLMLVRRGTVWGVDFFFWKEGGLYPARLSQGSHVYPVCPSGTKTLDSMINLFCWAGFLTSFIFSFFCLISAECGDAVVGAESIADRKRTAARKSENTSIVLIACVVCMNPVKHLIDHTNTVDLHIASNHRCVLSFVYFLAHRLVWFHTLVPLCWQYCSCTHYISLNLSTHISPVIQVKLLSFFFSWSIASIWVI